MWWALGLFCLFSAVFGWAVCAGAAKLDNGLDDALDEDMKLFDR